MNIRFFAVDYHKSDRLLGKTLIHRLFVISYYGARKINGVISMSSTKITKKELLAHAKPLNIKGASKFKKTDLIHTIQVAEGNNPCFLTITNCNISPCLYRSECQA